MNNLIPISAGQLTQNRLSDLVDKFIFDQDIKDSSRALYRRTLKQFFVYLEAARISLSTVSRAEVLGYKKALLDKGLSPLTVGSYITVLRKFYVWTESTKLYPNVAKDVKLPRRKQGFKKEPLVSSQIEKLLYSFDTSTVQGKRDYAIINLLLRTGLRTIELVRANISDITYKRGQRVLFIHGKGRDAKDELVVLTESAYKPLKDWLEARGRVGVEAPLFCSLSNRGKGKTMTTRSISRIVKEALRLVGLDSNTLTAHSLRHTAAVTALQAGASLYETQLFLRHSNPATTQIYLKTIEESQRLDKAPERLLDSAYPSLSM